MLSPFAAALPRWMRGARRALALLFVAAGVCGAEPPPPAAPRPVVLIDAWGAALDHVLMRAWSDQGFAIDAISHHELTRERLHGCNVLVMVDFPAAGTVTKNPWHGPASGPNRAETLALLEEFLAAGGGVQFILLQHADDVDSYDSINAVLARWGARRPLERLTVAQSQRVEHPRLHIPFFYTDQVLPGPVSEGVRGVWFPLGAYWSMAGPLSVDERWTVVLRGPVGSRTEPIPLEAPKPGVPYWAEPWQRAGGVADPVLYAIRDLAPGRLALMHCAPIFHIGSGSSWLHNGAMLDKGLAQRPSDFGRLLQNTWRWLAEPSLAQGRPGGMAVPPERWTPPLLRPEAFAQFAEQPVDLSPALVPEPVPLHRGIIGPRTVRSGGTGDVADYAAVARTLGLGFLIFLEDFAELTPEELTGLRDECRKHSGPDLLLVPGYRARTNLGNQIFLFGQDPMPVADGHLGGADGRTVQLQPEDGRGGYGPSRFIDFVFASLRGEQNSIGYFDFTGPARTGGMQMQHLKLFSMAGVVYEDHGRLVEDVTDQYLVTNQGTMTAIPVAVSLLDSPAELAAAVARGRAVTWAAAPRAGDLWRQALRWNNQYDGMNVFPSSGPRIQAWPGTHRTAAFAAEPFAAGRMLITPSLHVSAEAGLREVALYDGTRLFRRFLPGGAPEFRLRLFLSGALQRNVAVVATDTRGGKAVSYPLRCWSDGAPAPVFCSDHVNDCGGMKLFRGPNWPNAFRYPELADAGQTWDGGPTAVMPLLDTGQLYPSLTAGKVLQHGSLYTVPYLDFCDERVFRGSAVATHEMLPGVPHINSWSGFGPLTPLPLANMSAATTLWTPYATGVATGWGPQGVASGPLSSLYTQTATFRQDTTLTGLHLSHAWRRPLAANVLLLTGTGDRLLTARDISPRRGGGQAVYRLPAGAWYAAISAQEGNAALWVNRGADLRLTVREDYAGLDLDLPAAGQTWHAGQTQTVELFCMAWPLDQGIPDSDALLRRIRYLMHPDGLELRRGERLQTPPGLVELRATDGAVELRLPRPADNLPVILPVRVLSFNRRWSVLLWQREGFNGAGRYGPPQDRVRPLGVDEAGRAAFPLDAPAAPVTHLVVGHPVVATDAAGAELFIEVVCLRDARASQPPLWHVSVNNPTDAPVTSRFQAAMALPGLVLPAELVTIPAGGYVVLQHPAVP